MAADTIRRLLFAPPIAIARLGGSSTPMDAFTWGPGDPHTGLETRVRPDWTLDVRADATVVPHRPTALQVRDGALVRPVAPFLELWALVGDGAALTAVPVTPELLAANGTDEHAVVFSVTAMNLKAARRAERPELRFGTFGPVRLRGDEHQVSELRGESPPGTGTPMIPRGRFVRLGRIQVLRPSPRPAQAAWPPEVRTDVVRLRFTPGPGRVYGPPAAALTDPVAVPADQAFLDPAAGWFGAQRGVRVAPPDTLDERPGTEVSLGVVDDTCDAVVEAVLEGTDLRARATVTVGPPHFAPDRRPFLSLADELNDREHDPARDSAMTDADRREWVEDLFERIAETVSLSDVDFLRRQHARSLRPEERAAQTIPGDGLPGPTASMGGRDALRDPDIAVAPVSDIEPRPLSARARERHRQLSDIDQLAPWILEHPDRLRSLVREPFGRLPDDTPNVMSMQMPAFMRNSNAWPLSLARWQYDLLMAWADALVAAPGEMLLAAAPELSPEAAERRRQVLAVLDAEADR